MTFKAALLCSVAIHGGLLAVRPAQGWVPPRKTLHTIDLVYEPVVFEKSQKVPAPAIRPSTGSGRTERSAPVRAELVEVPQGRPVEARTPPPPPPEVLAMDQRPVPTDRVLSPTEATVLPAESFALIEHKRQVKEHLRSHLTHPGGGLEGTVHLRLTLGPQGALEELLALATSSPTLAELALQGARAAIPYPKFPQEVTEDSIQYEFLVQYQAE